ncbi:hypothetical protein ALP8811_02732 [Aliiroseovarius pelagivivens]|uniref:Flagellar hook-length control protein-like C-terminal domain-containing protein n=1 Tax=Aliiroseovarius pelagivivens TaxID=1639690 RepID=A0A2R8AS43_9RHOB|nr:flagellar hook-length control protein FliK [Aliiroseovarius pelagivivens]SPF78800.1 hypothetical protein ALP8811_02732 [Aliiroseovarius pelagivivens]
MQIAQLLSLHLGQTGRELQIPSEDLGAAAGSLATPFDMVFLAQIDPLVTRVELPAESDANLVGDEQVSEGQKETEHAPLMEPSELAVTTPNPVGRARAEFPVTAVSIKRMGDPAIQEDVDVVVSSKPLDRNSPETGGVNSEPDSVQLTAWGNVPPGRLVGPVEVPESTGEAQPKFTEAEMPILAATLLTEEPVAGSVVPGEQAPKPAEPHRAQAEAAWPFIEQAFAEASSDRVLHTDPTVAQSHVLTDAAPQLGRAPNPAIAAVVAKVLESGPIVDEPSQTVNLPAETDRPLHSTSVVMPESIEPKDEQNDTHKPSGNVVERLWSSTNQPEKSAFTAPVSNAVPELGVRSLYSPDAARSVSLPLTSTPLMPVTAQEAEHTPADETGFRMVEHVTTSSSDLKPATITRGLDVPRMIPTQITEIIRQQPDRPIELTLSPEELGRLRMSFQSEGSAMHVTLSFERPDTLDLMRRHIDQLAQEMRAFGMPNVSFTFQQQTSGEGGESFSDDGSARPSNEQQPDLSGGPDNITPIILSVADRAGVDIRV